MSAWRSLLGVMIMPRRRKRVSICSSRPGSRTSLRPHTSAMISRVRSSWVGPSPPLVMTKSARSSARPMTSFMRPGLSPTMVLKKRLTPRSDSRWAIHAELVSTICPSNSSDPMATISALGTLYSYSVFIADLRARIRHGLASGMGRMMRVGATGGSPLRESSHQPTSAQTPMSPRARPPRPPLPPIRTPPAPGPSPARPATGNRASA